MCAWMGREKEHKEEISRRLERRDFLGPMTSLSLSLEMEDSYSREAGPVNLWEGKQLKALTSSFPTPAPRTLPGEDLPRSGEGCPTSGRPDMWESHSGSPQREPNACSLLGLPAFRCSAVLRPGHACVQGKPLKFTWRKKHAEFPWRRRGSQVVPCGQADTPGLQLYPCSSFGPDEFHRVSGCSLVGEGIAGSQVTWWPSRT